MEDLSYRCMDPTELKAEANNHAHNKQSHEVFEASHSPHGSRRRIENEYYQNIQDGDSAASHQWNVKEDVQSNCCTNNLNMSVHLYASTLRIAYFSNICREDG
jgi:hypothetical protein